MDVNCGSYLQKHTKSTVQQKKLAVSEIDGALHNLFSIRTRLDLFKDDPKKQPFGDIIANSLCSPSHQVLALQAAQNGIVPLKNFAKLPPLLKLESMPLAVVGPNANSSQTLPGNYAGPPCVAITPLQAFRSYAKNSVYHPGCDTVACTSASILAKQADNVVLFMGLDQTQEKEELDRVDLMLPGKQQQLIINVAKVAKKPVLVVLCGGPVDIYQNIGIILWAGYPGDAGGLALAEIIFGDNNPGGRLPMNWFPNDFIKALITDIRCVFSRCFGLCVPGNICSGDILSEMGMGDHNIFNLDDNLMDPLLCATSACETYKQLCASEAKKRPSADFMGKNQKDINPSMRAILINCLVEVAEDYRLVPDTLYLTVNYIDRYLSGNPMNRQCQQLPGADCVMIALKYEEICAHQEEELCYMTDNTYFEIGMDASSVVSVFHSPQSEVVPRSLRREPLAEIAEIRNLPQSVAEAEIVLDTNGLDTEHSSTGTCYKVRKKLGYYNNIVSSVSSFISLVQQKQEIEAAIITGNSNFKVNVIQAAEDAKQLALELECI